MDNRTMSQIGLYTAESLREAKTKMHMASTYINPKGGLLNSPRTDMVERTILGLMRR